jgi:hypothetical protein
MKKVFSIAMVLMLALLIGESGAHAQQTGRGQGNHANCPYYTNTDGTTAQGTPCPRMGKGAMNGKGMGCPRNPDGCVMAKRGATSDPADKAKTPGAN